MLGNTERCSHAVESPLGPRAAFIYMAETVQFAHNRYMLHLYNASAPVATAWIPMGRSLPKQVFEAGRTKCRWRSPWGARAASAGICFETWAN